MAQTRPPSIFVSSTCYDLSQVRLDLKRFIEGLGYDAIISESSAFPINPHATAIQNCINAVRDRADVLVLIVGSRYGSAPPGEHGRSITNLEYLEAKAKGIPIYVFIADQIVHALPIWKQNPTADYSKVCDTPKLFEFADHLKNESGLWVFEFSEAADISNTLRQQWAILFNDSLELRNKVLGSAYGPDLLELASEPLSILLKKPRAWEHRFFTAVMRSELRKLDPIKLDLKYGIRIGPVTELTKPIEMLDWMQTQMERGKRLIASATNLNNAALQEALGPKGVAGDPRQLVYVGRRVADVVREMLNWRTDFQTASVGAEFETLMSMVGGMLDKTLSAIESLPNLLDSEIDKALAAEARGEDYVATVNLVLDVPVSPELQAEMKRVKDVVVRMAKQGLYS